MSASEALRRDGEFSSAKNLAGNVDEIWRRWGAVRILPNGWKMPPKGGTAAAK
jgi:hypothetical protein